MCARERTHSKLFMALANHDAALELGARARAAFESGNEVEATRLAQRSFKLYETPDVKLLLDHLRQFGPGSPAAIAVQRVLQCPAGAHHQVMELDQHPPPSNSLVKAAYRRLSLLLHPDRNRARGAEDAFKRLGAALDALSGGQQREQQRTRQTPPPQSNSSAQVEALEKKVRSLESSNELLKHECKRLVDLLNEADSDRATLRRESRRAREAEEKLKARVQRLSAELLSLLELLEKEERVRDAQVMELHTIVRRVDHDGHVTPTRTCSMPGRSRCDQRPLVVRRVLAMHDLLAAAQLEEYAYAFIHEQGCKRGLRYRVSNAWCGSVPSDSSTCAYQLDLTFVCPSFVSNDVQTTTSIF